VPFLIIPNQNKEVKTNKNIIGKIFRIAPVFLRRVALQMVMVLALAVILLPTSTPATEAAEVTPCFSTVLIPKIGAAGGYVMTPNVDVGAIAVSPNGTVPYSYWCQ